MKNNLLKVASFALMVVYIFLGLATSQDENFYDLQMNVERDGQSLIISHTDNFDYNDVELNVTTEVTDSTFNFYTLSEYTLAQGVTDTLPLANFLPNPQNQSALDSTEVVKSMDAFMTPVPLEDFDSGTFFKNWD